MAAFSDFYFMAFPFEIRKHIYLSMLEGQVVHCCPDEKQIHHTRAEAEETQEDRFFDDLMQYSSNCYDSLSREVRCTNIAPPDEKQVNHNRAKAEETQKDRFFDDFLHCSSNCYESFSHEVRWTNIAPSDGYLPSPSDVLNFLLSCKTVWNEMEPLLWKYMTFCIGLPQFAGFYERFLVQGRSSHPITSPRAQLLQRISLALIQRLTLANSIGNDSRFRNISSFGLVSSAKRKSLGYLKEQCTGLQHLIALVDGPTFGESHSVGGPALGFEDTLTILHFKGLKSFKLMVHGPIERTDSKVTYHSAPSTHPMKLALDVSQSALTEILTRTAEPSRDMPPEGISSTDPDYLWLKEHYERDAEGDPRLTELILKTRLYLGKQGIEMLPVADTNF